MSTNIFTARGKLEYHLKKLSAFYRKHDPQYNKDDYHDLQDMIKGLKKFDGIEVLKLAQELVYTICLFSIEGSVANSIVGLGPDNTMDFITGLMGNPEWSPTRYADIVKIIQEKDFENLPKYIDDKMMSIVAKINSLWEVS